MTQTHTLQTWPSGTSYTYRGDLHGPPEQRSLRVEQYNGTPQLPWCRGTAAEWRTLIVAERAERLVCDEVLCCQSGLVSELLKLSYEGRSEIGDAFGDEEIRNLYPDPSGSEVYEWWLVTPWLCKELHAIGEVTIDNGYGCWWGRTCTGQSMIQDGTLQQVAARHVD